LNLSFYLFLFVRLTFILSYSLFHFYPSPDFVCFNLYLFLPFVSCFFFFFFFLRLFRLKAQSLFSHLFHFYPFSRFRLFQSLFISPICFVFLFFLMFPILLSLRHETKNMACFFHLFHFYPFSRFRSFISFLSFLPISFIYFIFILSPDFVCFNLYFLMFPILLSLRHETKNIACFFYFSVCFDSKLNPYFLIYFIFIIYPDFVCFNHLLPYALQILIKYKIFSFTFSLNNRILGPFNEK